MSDVGGRIFGAIECRLNREGAKNAKGLLVVCSGDNKLPFLSVLCVLSGAGGWVWVELS